jgi:hypothetical protein
MLALPVDDELDRVGLSGDAAKTGAGVRRDDEALEFVVCLAGGQNIGAFLVIAFGVLLADGELSYQVSQTSLCDPLA